MHDNRIQTIPLRCPTLLLPSCPLKPPLTSCTMTSVFHPHLSVFERDSHLINNNKTGVVVSVQY